MRRQNRINHAVSKRKETKQYVQTKSNNIYPRRISVNYHFYRPRKIRTKKWVEPATHLGPIILLGKNKPVAKNFTLKDIYNKPIPKQKK